MNSLAFMTHSSVRVKGTENNYNPTICTDSACSNKSPHMHCPFCVKTESYQDPVILKAHYRVKHVDKGIEFAGLKILRCCDHCDIIGVIKGEKKFKGAHWHCYKCRNGFNRRDEAIKHFKTHFRNPQTTFQIQIAQEVNHSVTSTECQTATTSISQDHDIIHPVLTQAACLATSDHAIIAQDGSNLNGKPSENTVQVSIAANETINTADGQTIMIISEEQLESAQIENSFGAQIISSEDVSFIESEKESLEKRHEIVEIRNQRLEEERNDLKAEVDQLKMHIQIQNEEIAGYKKREQELMQQVNANVNINMQDLLTQLEAQHREVLQMQLSQLRQTYMERISQEVPVTSNVVHLHFPATSQEQVNNTSNAYDEDKSDKSSTIQAIEIGSAPENGIAEEETEISTSTTNPVTVTMDQSLIMCVEQIDGPTVTPNQEQDSIVSDSGGNEDVEQTSVKVECLSHSGRQTGHVSPEEPSSSEMESEPSVKRRKVT